MVLHQAADVSVTGDPYRRGLAFLLETQRGDGSWLVSARDYPGRPANAYFEWLSTPRIAVHFCSRHVLGGDGARTDESHPRVID